MGIKFADDEMKKYYAGAKGIISRVNDDQYHTPVVSRYGTFADFLRLSRQMYDDGKINKTAITGEHDGKEKIVGDTYDSWIEDWVRYAGKKGSYGIEFHTVRHYRYKGDDLVYKKFERPTAANDTQFSAYRKALAKGKTATVYSRPPKSTTIDDFVRKSKR